VNTPERPSPGGFSPGPTGSPLSALDELFWRDEILQALFWMRGEGLAEAVTWAELARFLGADEAVVKAELARLEHDGYVEGVRSRESGFWGEAAPGHSPPTPDARLLTPAYSLTPLGAQEGGRRFRDEFVGLTRQAHAECGPGCWCQDPDHEGEPCPNKPNQEPERARA
jgi:hypothetical protein